MCVCADTARVQSTAGKLHQIITANEYRPVSSATLVPFFFDLFSPLPPLVPGQLYQSQHLSVYYANSAHSVTLRIMFSCLM